MSQIYLTVAARVERKARVPCAKDARASCAHGVIEAKGITRVPCTGDTWMRAHAGFVTQVPSKI